MHLKHIGIIHSPFLSKESAPRQGRKSKEVSTIEIFSEFADGLKHIEEVSHLIVLYWGHLGDRNVLQGKTPFSEKPIGVFSSRSPQRPNPIAFCVVKLLKRSKNTLKVEGIDAVDGSPLLDIKVYSPEIDCVAKAENDWIENDFS